MPYVSSDDILEARKMDLLTYLQNYEPQELVRFSADTYTTKSHDSLKISNGKWMWWSRGIGGYTALDYLVKVRNMPFIKAVEAIIGRCAIQPPVYEKPKENTPKALFLPQKSGTDTVVTSYLCGRGIDREIIKSCIDNGLIFESLPYHNVVFVGFDEGKKPRYASFRATNDKRILGDCAGSDKHYSFQIVGGQSRAVHIFECPIDLLSYATLLKMRGYDFTKINLVSLAGVYSPAKNIYESKIPVALQRYLERYPDTQKIVTHFDNDRTGVLAAEAIKILLQGKYMVVDSPPPKGKDFNDFLCMEKNIHQNKTLIRREERE